MVLGEDLIVRHWLTKVLTLALLAAIASAPALAQGAVDEGVYLLGAGDELRLRSSTTLIFQENFPWMATG